MEKYLRYKDEPDFIKNMYKPNYRLLMLLYGQDILLFILGKFERCQNFEECAKIKAAIVEHNQICGDSILIK